MKLIDLRIGLSVYLNEDGLTNFGQHLRGVRLEVIELTENTAKVLLENNGITAHLGAFPHFLSTTKPMTISQALDLISTLEVQVHNQRNEIDTLEGQARERSRQLDLTKGVADKYNADLARMGDKLKQADRQILRHEDSLKTIRASNEVLRGTNESLMFEKAQMAEKVALLTAELMEVKTQRDQLQQLGDKLCDSGEKEVETLNSTIVSLRSQIESLQSIQESMKMMQEGHAPAMKKLQGELHNAIHQRDQHKQNSAYWRGVADKLGYNDPGITADKLAPTKDARLDKIEMFLRDQFESFR